MATADQKIRKYGKLTQKEILQRIVNGSLIVDVDEARVYRLRKSGRLEEFKQYERGRCGRYRAVCIYVDGSRTKIGVHSLVWIAANRRTIPEGYEVHHEDRDPSNNRINNLDLQSKLKHQLTHDKGYPDSWDEDEDF